MFNNNHQKEADDMFKMLFNKVESLALDICITYPKTVKKKKQTQRAIYETESCKDYYYGYKF